MGNRKMDIAPSSLVQGSVCSKTKMTNQNGEDMQEDMQHHHNNKVPQKQPNGIGIKKVNQPEQPKNTLAKLVEKAKEYEISENIEKEISTEGITSVQDKIKVYRKAIELKNLIKEMMENF